MNCGCPRLSPIFLPRLSLCGCPRLLHVFHVFPRLPPFVVHVFSTSFHFVSKTGGTLPCFPKIGKHPDSYSINIHPYELCARPLFLLGRGSTTHRSLTLPLSISACVAENEAPCSAACDRDFSLVMTRGTNSGRGSDFQVVCRIHIHRSGQTGQRAWEQRRRCPVLTVDPKLVRSGSSNVPLLLTSTWQFMQFFSSPGKFT